ncbi:MAG: ankyrin repeat domain-containing protein [Pirellulaceae bacterium]
MTCWKVKLMLCAAVVLFAAGCNRVTPEDVRAANKLARDGKVRELQQLLEEKPGLANGLVDEDCSLLELLVEVVPAYPNTSQTVKILLEHGADPNYDAPEILRKAIWRGNPEIVEMLLQHGADPTIVSQKKSMNMLEYARSQGDQRLAPIVQAWEEKNRT